MLLGEILVRNGAIDGNTLDEALKEQAVRSPRPLIGALLEERGLITERQLAAALAEQCGLDAVFELSGDMFDASLVAPLTVDWARTHEVLPVRLGGRVAMLTADPLRLEAQDDLRVMLGVEVVPVVTTRTMVKQAVERCYFERDDTAKAFLDQMAVAAPVPPAAVSGGNDLLRTSDDAPVAQLVNLILLGALKERASDVHIEPLGDRLRIRYRIDGLLYEQASPPKHLEASLVSRLKVMGHLDIAEKRLPQDGMARVRVGEREVDIRISTVPVPEGERTVLRLLDRSSTLMALTDLGMPQALLERFRGVITHQDGIVLITGPTGSGKTTTLYAALQELDTGRRNVMTIEDPVEYQLPNVGQIQVKPKIGLTFARGLRHILRQDPDVILVGETRDLEAAEVMTRASLTGHLVFTTLHTNDAVSALVRLADMGIAPYLLAAAVRASLAQRLVRKLCPACREERAPTDEERRVLKGWPAGDRSATVWSARGCDNCLGGYTGRTGIYELLLMTEALQEAVRVGSSLRELTAINREGGGQTLLESGIELVRSGQTSIDEIMRTLGRSAMAHTRP
jgi:general secretion pathway protein E